MRRQALRSPGLRRSVKQVLVAWALLRGQLPLCCIEGSDSHTEAVEVRFHQICWLAWLLHCDFEWLGCLDYTTTRFRHHKLCATLCFRAVVFAILRCFATCGIAREPLRGRPAGLKKGTTTKDVPDVCALGLMQPRLLELCTEVHWPMLCAYSGTQCEQLFSKEGAVCEAAVITQNILRAEYALGNIPSSSRVLITVQFGCIDPDTIRHAFSH